MEPTLVKDKYYLLEKARYMFSDPKRGDIVVFPSPVKKNHDLVKRVIAISGDTIAMIDKKVYLNGSELKETYVQYTRPDEILQGDNMPPLVVPEGKVFVMGDNRDVWGDSRDWIDEATGQHMYFVDVKKIKGKILELF
jgi:signal peptidase I